MFQFYSETVVDGTKCDLNGDYVIIKGDIFFYVSLYNISLKRVQNV